jgi:hypothetical protein
VANLLVKQTTGMLLNLRVTDRVSEPFPADPNVVNLRSEAVEDLEPIPPAMPRPDAREAMGGLVGSSNEINDIPPGDLLEDEEPYGLSSF